MRPLENLYKAAVSSLDAATKCFSEVAVKHAISLIGEIVDGGIGIMNLARLNEAIPQLRLKGQLVEALGDGGEVYLEDSEDHLCWLKPDEQGSIVELLETLVEEIKKGDIKVYGNPETYEHELYYSKS